MNPGGRAPSRLVGEVHRAFSIHHEKRLSAGGVCARQVRLVVRAFAVLIVAVSLLAAPAAAGISLDPAMVPPSPPMNVEATSDGDEVTVTWDPPLFMGGASSVTYRVYKGDSLIATDLTATEFVDTVGGAASASAASTSYSVTAVNDAGESMHDEGQCLDSDLGISPGNCVTLVLDTVWWVIGQLPP